MSKTYLQWLQLGESFKMALAAIKTGKLRSILTLLGIAVGVFSIIAVMTAVRVLQSSIEDGISQLGANTFQMQKFPVTMGNDHENHHKYHNRKNISYEQGMQVKNKVTLAQAVGLEGWRGGRVVVSNGVKTNPNIGIVGEDVDGMVTNDLTVEAGRSLDQQDIEMAANVAILGKPVAEKLFPPHVDPIGQTIRFDGELFKVIGLLQKKGGGLGGNQDNYLIIPLPTFFQLYGRDNVDLHIMVKAKNREVLDDCIEQSRLVLRTARKVAPGAEDDFGYFSNDSLVKQFNDFTFFLRMGVLLVSSIALLAAGVGIMNIMLVSVTERTREIGIRKSIGAQKRDILSQFIIEAVILSQMGGILGVILGILGGNVVGLLLNVPAVIPWDWAAIGIISCSLVGLTFGVYPAWKAAALDPIEALRYE